MRRITLAPASPRAGHRPVLITTGLTALLLLSACGSGDDTIDQGPPAPSPTATASDAPSPTGSASRSAKASASPSDTPASKSPADAGETEGAPGTPPEEVVPGWGAVQPDNAPAAPVPGAPAPLDPAAPPANERTAQAPEVGLPPAAPFVPPTSGAPASASSHRGPGNAGVPDTPAATDALGSPQAESPAAATCVGSQLTGSVSPQQGAAGSVLASLTLTNTGSTPCTLQGYPGVSFVDAAGNVVGAPAVQTGAASAPVVLQPGQSAAAPLRMVQPGVIGQVCNPHDTQGLRVYPPGSTESLVVTYPGQACGNPKVEQLQVRGFGG